jgi:SLOG-like protein
MSTDKELLPSNALKEIRIGISISDSPDLAWLGLLETHMRLALGEIARCVLISEGKLAYGGRLDAKGYTSYLIQELHRYSRRDRPIRICLAWQEHRRLSIDQLKKEKEALGLFGEIVFLDTDGSPIDPKTDRPQEPVPESDDDIRKRALTSMRQYMQTISDGRILIGGKRHGFQGDFPGVVEEAIISLEANQPIYPAGGFGGATLDIINALGVDDGSWLPERPHAPAPDERMSRGLDILSELSSRKDWSGLQNGLSDVENRQLAATHRPSEIATLISLGLGRRFNGVQE